MKTIKIILGICWMLSMLVTYMATLVYLNPPLINSGWEIFVVSFWILIGCTAFMTPIIFYAVFWKAWTQKIEDRDKEQKHLLELEKKYNTALKQLEKAALKLDDKKIEPHENSRG
jgi:hypothetical protein